MSPRPPRCDRPRLECHSSAIGTVVSQPVTWSRPARLQVTPTAYSLRWPSTVLTLTAAAPARHRSDGAAEVHRPAPGPAPLARQVSRCSDQLRVRPGSGNPDSAPGNMLVSARPDPHGAVHRIRVVLAPPHHPSFLGNRGGGFVRTRLAHPESMSPRLAPEQNPGPPRAAGVARHRRRCDAGPGVSLGLRGNAPTCMPRVGRCVWTGDRTPLGRREVVQLTAYVSLVRARRRCCCPSRRRRAGRCRRR